MANSSVVNVSEYTAPIRRWFLVILIASLLGALIGFFLFQTRSTAYVAEAQVQVRPLVSQSIDSSVDVDRQINTTTEEAVASSQRVAERAINIVAVANEKGDPKNYTDQEVLDEAITKKANVKEVQQLLENVEVEVIDDSQILVVKATDNDPEKAQELAQSVAVAYIDFRKTEALRARVEARSKLLARQESLGNDLAKIYENNELSPEGNVVGGPDAQILVGIQQELESIGQAFASLEASNVDSGVVLSDARIPESREGLPQIAGPIIGGLLGLILGLTMVFVIDRQDDRLRSADTELAALGVPVLGNAPVHSKPSSGISLFANNSSGADAYRRVQGSLLFNLQQENKSLIVIAGIKGSKASSFVASNLAAMAARSGRKTLLVGADLRKKPLNDGIGLSDVVVGKASLANAIENLRDVDANLDLLGGGTVTSRPADILQSESFGRLLSTVHSDYDLVMVEAPAILDVADAMDISRLCEGTLIVVDSTTESRHAIADSISQVRNVGSDIVGVVVTHKST